MLTGDKGETARMIGLLCGMLWCGGRPMSEQQNQKTVFRRIDEGSDIDILCEFNELDKIIQSGVSLEIMISGAKLAILLKDKAIS
jgi:magnesium-transporting ATPase (P-type)